MLKLLLVTAIMQCISAQQYQQKVAPGVPPQNYQNYQPPPPPPQQMPLQQQQPPQQYAQQQQNYQPPPPPPPQQYQQVNVQQQHVQQPVQQPMGHEPHGHHGDPQLLNPANIASEREHIKEHMDVPIDTSKMSEQELQFHYFKMHDNDNNNKLDGCELIKSLIHWHGEVDKNHRAYTDEELEAVLEYALKNTDINKDGYIDFVEYRFSNYKAENAVKDQKVNENLK